MKKLKNEHSCHEKDEGEVKNNKTKDYEDVEDVVNENDKQEKVVSNRREVVTNDVDNDDDLDDDDVDNNVRGEEKKDKSMINGDAGNTQLDDAIENMLDVAFV